MSRLLIGLGVGVGLAAAGGYATHLVTHQNNPNSPDSGGAAAFGIIAGGAAVAGLLGFKGLSALGKSIKSGRFTGGIMGTASTVAQTGKYMARGTERLARGVFTGGVGPGAGKWLPNWNMAPTLGKDGKEILDLRRFLPNPRIIRRFGALSVPLLGAGAVAGVFSTQSAKPSSLYVGPDGMRHVNDMGAAGALNMSMMQSQSPFMAPDVPSYIYGQALDDLALPLVRGMF